MSRAKINNQISHGGNLREAARQYDIPLEKWVDLSTGISPWTYPIPDIPESVWRRLPYLEESFLEAASGYYRSPIHALTPVAGSQDAIRRIPFLLPSSTVAIPNVGYQEHRHAWQSANHHVYGYDSFADLQQKIQANKIDHLVIINPNNPTTEFYSTAQIEWLYEHVTGYIVIDEAFVDLTPELATVYDASQSRLIILRSIGKFFGLAGLRLGFIVGENPVLELLRHDVMPWGINHPAMFIGEKALSDGIWQRQQTQRIHQQMEHLLVVLNTACKQSVDRIVSAGLFVTLQGSQRYLLTLYQLAAQQGILLRYGELEDQQAWLRIGLPTDEELLTLQRFLTNTNKNSFDI